MSRLRLIAPFLVASAIVVAACASTGASGSPAASDPAASPSADMSAAPSVDASASASADASAAPSASASGDLAGGGGDGDALAAMIPATVGDVAMSVTITDADSYIRANVNRQLSPILTALNKTPTDVTVATATGASTGGATLFIDAVQVSGADAEALLTAFQTAATAVPGTTVEAADVGGKSVVKATTASYTMAVYASGDVLFYVQSPDAALVDQAIAALP